MWGRGEEVGGCCAWLFFYVAGERGNGGVNRWIWLAIDV